MKPLCKSKKGLYAVSVDKELLKQLRDKLTYSELKNLRSQVVQLLQNSVKENN